MIIIVRTNNIYTYKYLLFERFGKPWFSLFSCICVVYILISMKKKILSESYKFRLYLQYIILKIDIIYSSMLCYCYRIRFY